MKLLCALCTSLPSLKLSVLTYSPLPSLQGSFYLRSLWLLMLMLSREGDSSEGEGGLWGVFHLLLELSFTDETGPR